MKSILNIAAVAITVVTFGLVGCGSGSGSSTSSTSSGTSVDSLTDIPSVSTLVNGGSSASSSESASLKSMSKAVTGTAPLLLSINSATTADTYFWGGLVATINSQGSATAQERTAFWNGEGSCRMFQNAGMAFQNIQSAGSSLCYLQNVPNAAAGLTVVSGTVSSASAIFDKASSTRIIKATATNTPGEGGGQGESQDIFIKVYGSDTTEASGGNYAIDLWFCGQGSVGGYEKIRYNASTGVLSDTSADSNHGGSFASIVSGHLTTSSGQLVYDSTQTQSANFYFAQQDGSSEFLGYVSTDSGRLISKSYNTGSFGGGPVQVFKSYVIADYEGDTMDTVRFTQGGFSVRSTFGSEGSFSFSGGSEYQTNVYASMGSGELVDLAAAIDFTDTIYSGATTDYTTIISAASDFSCSATADVVVAMDMSLMPEVTTACENHFENMNFCDGDTISTARNIAMQGEFSN